MEHLIPLLFIVPLVAFWLWMFRDMVNNRYLPDATRENWTLAFIVLNVFAAGVYYATEYRNARYR